jgi:hypothetical protein
MSRAVECYACATPSPARPQNRIGFLISKQAIMGSKPARASIRRKITASRTPLEEMVSANRDLRNGRQQDTPDASRGDYF